MSNIKAQMSNKIQSPKPKYDLGERTAEFGEQVIILTKKLEAHVVNRPLISQLVRASTSIGANYMEADGAESKKDFQHKIALCKKEAKETMHWLRMLAVANSVIRAGCRKMWQEAHEVALIFSSILRGSVGKKSLDF